VLAVSADSFRDQVEFSQLLALNALDRSICYPFLGQPIVSHVNRKPAAAGRKHGKTLNRLAPRPQSQFLQAIPRQSFPGNAGGLVVLKPHGSIPVT
jgi:hypothetical protein